MKTIVMLMLSAALIVPITLGQTKVVSFKKLQEFLPTKELKGFERKKPTGQTQSAMGMTTSEAKVRFVQPQKENEQENSESTQQQSIEISISDMAGVPYGQMTAMAYAQDFENETEDGYEKSIVIKGYRGKESSRTGDSRNCSLEFLVGNRFVVKMQGDGFSEAAVLHQLAESMDLAKLEKTSS